MKILMMLAMTLITLACGRNDDADEVCRNAEQMKQECFRDNAPIYGTDYAAEICTNTYTIQRCY